MQPSHIVLIVVVLCDYLVVFLRCYWLWWCLVFVSTPY